MLMAIFIVAIVILVVLLAFAYMFYTFSNNFCIFASNYESAELTKIKLMNSIKKELSKTNNTEEK